MLEVSIIKCLMDNYSYLIKDKETDLVGVVDPSEFKPVDVEINRTYKKLDFILNTHHHFDHIGGNTDLKKKYNSKIIASTYDEKRIPDIDIKKKDGDFFSIGKTNFEVVHIPGHTLGHICFFSKQSKVLFVGDTLFSLGCGRIFEGTFEQMFKSLEKIKNLPKDTMIYCGHEYTLKNSEFCLKNDEKNLKLKEKIILIKEKLSHGTPTIPTTLKEELECNIFLRSDNELIQKNLNTLNELDTFSKLRDLKDNF